MNPVRFIPALAAVMVLSAPLSAGDKTDAKGLFEQMEKKLAQAKTIHLTVTGKFAFGKEKGTSKATALLAPGNKVRLDFTFQGGGKSAEVTLVSNGTKLKAVSSGKGFKGKEKDAPKLLRENLVYTLSRVGFTPAFMQTKPRDPAKPEKDNIVVSDFRLGKLDKGDEFGGRPVHVLDYQFALGEKEPKVAATLYIDAKTLLPLVRTIPSFGNLREEYQYRLNKKLAEGSFELPK